MGVWLMAWDAARGQVVNTPPVPDWIQAPGNKTNEAAFFRPSDVGVVSVIESFYANRFQSLKIGVESEVEIHSAF